MPKYKTGKQIQSEILRYCRKAEGIAAFNIVMADRGAPDILACVNGKFMGFEIKGHRDRVTAIQAAQARRIIEAGGECFVVRSLDEFKEKI